MEQGSLRNGSDLDTKFGHAILNQKLIHEQLEVQRQNLESIYMQKSKNVWLQKKDKNGKFFHTSLMVQRRKNKILAIKDQEGWIHTE